ncbi:hypothetical protein A2Z10_00950 [Candidatus Azambacteria bacterium RBG_16_47_10]|uniref:Diacylglycerol kinase n=1 Tax=Candidatus Azambacteria bacterium RBG_16_47_10 TaxID=1797292 RepID=A0A1F5B0B6_9BACT|nr:MAG: hypothetical protein A2Z10_00950 [Candidatus Azambacteria bacterium RBG_16_47_10]
MKTAKRILKSFRHAFKGIHEAFVEGQNFRIMVYGVLASLVVFGMKPISSVYMTALIFSGAFMLVVELVNTAMEKGLDLVLPASLEEIRVIKDIMAAASLVASISWFLILMLALIA